MKNRDQSDVKIITHQNTIKIVKNESYNLIKNYYR